MADPLPNPPPVTETVTYRPISGFAVASVVAAGLFALLVAGSAAVALVQGVPFFFSPWLLLVALAGFVLALVAQSQIRNSEGTRAGASLASAGLWLSVVTGLGYFAYYYVTGLALANQADTFLREVGPDSGFFAHVQKAADDPASLHAAFLLTLPPGARGSVRPEDEQGMLKVHNVPTGEGMPGALAQFRDHFLIRLFCKGNAPESKVEPLGVLEWKYENRAYHVWRSYRLITPEVTIEFPVLVQSTEGESAGQVRKWYVVANQMGRPTRLTYTALGQGLGELRRNSRDMLNRWSQELNQGKTFPEVEKLDQTAWHRTGLPESQRAAAKERYRAFFNGTDKDRRGSLSFVADESLGDWEIVDGHVRLSHPFKLMVPHGDSALMLEGRVTLKSKQPIDPTALPAEPEWEFVSLGVIRAGAGMGKKGPG